MKFKLLPVLDTMIELYESPRDRKRFERYLFLLQGENKKDLLLPIAGYNPMGNEFVLSKINELKILNAERLIEQELEQLRSLLPKRPELEIKVVVNLADDIGGAWSHRYTTDYKSKFEIGSLVKRNFCAPFFWTGEAYTVELIASRAREYVLRTYHWITHGQPKTLAECVAQEVFVSAHAKEQKATTPSKTDAFYQTHQYSDDYNLIFNFFYGDEASRQLGYPIF